MTNKREPMIKPIPILSLRPTQMTVGIQGGEAKAYALAGGKIKRNSPSFWANT